MKTDSLVTNVIGKFFQRSALGQATYGTTLQEFQPSMKEKLVYIQEELLDSALYIEWLLQNVEELERIKEEQEKELREKEEAERIAKLEEEFGRPLSTVALTEEELDRGLLEYIMRNSTIYDPCREN